MKITRYDLNDHNKIYWKDKTLRELSDRHLANILKKFEAHKQGLKLSFAKMPLIYYALEKEKLIRLSEAAFEKIGLKVYPDEDQEYKGQITARFYYLMGHTPIHYIPSEIESFEIRGVK